MSVSSFPQSPSVARDMNISKKKDRPPALDITDSSKVSPSEHTYRTDEVYVPKVIHPLTSRFCVLHSAISQSHPMTRYEAASLHDQAFDHPRSASATSSLDPYYFSINSPTEPSPSTLHDPYRHSKTPETRPLNELSTPAKDPASIDRKGLFGLGELATPRWARSERNRMMNLHHDVDMGQIEAINEDLPTMNSQEDEPDSPWTIEAIDDEIEDRYEVRPCHLSSCFSDLFCLSVRA
jgi:dual specificity tyrosine-phosphorylation-regulated kinase 2/3/4